MRMHIDMVKVRRFKSDVILAVLVVLILNAILTVAVVRHAGNEVIWALSNRGIVNREMLRVNKLAIEGRVVSPVPFE